MASVFRAPCEGDKELGLVGMRDSISPHGKTMMTNRLDREKHVDCVERDRGQKQNEKLTPVSRGKVSRVFRP
jgi:hypothetical protein